MKKPTITKKAFLNWYFDYDTKSTSGISVLNELIETEESVTISVEKYFNECGYIPANLCEGLTEEQKNIENLEFETYQVELIGYGEGNDKAREKHQKIREILQEYNNPEFGDCIVDDICRLFNTPTTIDTEPENY
jgi:hypothetical protein